MKSLTGAARDLQLERYFRPSPPAMTPVTMEVIVQDDVTRSRRMAFLGLTAWVSLCLLLVGWGPPLGQAMCRLLACTGLVGLASAVGLAVNVKKEMQRQRELLDLYVSEARTDPLTGLANRRALNEELGRRIAQWRRRGTVLSLLLVDIDHFKRFNDQHGHQAGDEMLCLVARTLRSTLREMDVVSRFGGEEFAVVLPETNLAEAVRAAERIRENVAQAVLVLREQQLRNTVSIGVAQALETDGADALLRRADDALYAAKKAGRNRVWFHDGQTCLPVSEMAEALPVASRP